MNSDFIIAVDPNGIRDESDGAISGIVEVLYAKPQTTESGVKFVGLAGRIAFKCHSEQAKSLNVYAILEDGTILDTGVSDKDYADVPEGTALDVEGKFFCNTNHPATTNNQEKL